MMIYVGAAAGKWKRLWGEIITINFLNIHLDYASIFFWRGSGRGRVEEGGVSKKAGIAESLLAKWHHKIGSLLFCLQSGGMPGGAIPPATPALNGGNELCNLLQTCTQ